MTDWLRVAAPQSDGYDTEAIIRETVYPRASVLFTPQIAYATSPNADLIPAKPGDPLIDEVERRLLRWPLASRFVAMVHLWIPYRCSTWQGGNGCYSGNTHPSENGGVVEIFSSIDDPIGGAEGFVHETAHQRLNAVGISLEKHDGRLLLNDFEPKWFSPIRRDTLRPMSAVLHGIYAWTAMLEVDLAQGAEGLSYLAINVPKVRLGLEIIERGAQWTENGAAFFEGFRAWLQDILGRASAMLEINDVREVPVPGLGE